MDTESLSRKERERLFRREVIMQGAVKLFASKGFNGTTLDEIAEATEFGKGTIYNYFANKEEIFISIFKTEIQAYLSLITEADAETMSLTEFLKDYISRVFNRCVENPDAFILMVQEVINRELRSIKQIEEEFINFKKTGQEILLRRFDAGIKGGEIRNDLSARRLSNFLRHLLFPYLHEIVYHEDPKSLDWEKEVELVSSVFLNGILTNK